MPKIKNSRLTYWQNCWVGIKGSISAAAPGPAVFFSPQLERRDIFQAVRTLKPRKCPSQEPKFCLLHPPTLLLIWPCFRRESRFGQEM